MPCFSLFQKTVMLTVCSVPAVDSRELQSTLRDMIRRYFSSEGLDRTFLTNLGIPVLPVLQEITPEQEQQVRSDVHSLVAIHSDVRLTGRTIARIFHGIASPLFPAEVWERQHRFWRRHLSVDFNHRIYNLCFNTLCQIATDGETVGIEVITIHEII